MKKTKTSFGYELSDGKYKIKVLTQVLSDDKKSSYIVENDDGRKLYPRSLKGAKICVASFDEHYKIFNRNKV